MHHRSCTTQPLHLPVRTLGKTTERTQVRVLPAPHSHRFGYELVRSPSPSTSYRDHKVHCSFPASCALDRGVAMFLVVSSSAPQLLSDWWADHHKPSRSPQAAAPY